MKSRKQTNSFSVSPVFGDFITKNPEISELLEDILLKKGSSAKFKRLQQDGFYIVTSGLLKLEMIRPKPRILRLCSPGDLVGFGAWFNPGISSYQLTALTDSNVQFWTKESFFQLKAKRPEVSDVIIDHLVQTLIHKDERIALLETSSSEDRFALLLGWLAKKFAKKVDQGILIDVDLDREGFARLAGCSVVSVTRNISLFEDKNIIRRRRRKLIITDMDRFQKMLNEGPTS